MDRCRQVGARKLCAAPEPSCCLGTRCFGFPRRLGGWLGRTRRSSASTLAFSDLSPTPSARLAASRIGGHNSSEATVTPGGSSRLCTSNGG